MVTGRPANIPGRLTESRFGHKIAVRAAMKNAGTRIGRPSRTFLRLLPYRNRIQTAFLAVWLAPLHWFSVCGPVFHCNACPLASVACPIGVLARDGALHVLPVAALAVLITFGAALGTMTCGWACPFGWLQDMASKVPTRRWKLPRWTGHLRYVVLAVTVLAVPIIFGGGHPLFICRLCPAAGLEVSVPRLIRSALGPGPAIWPDAPKLAVLVLFLGAIFVFHRPWCRVLCPLGAVFGLFNRISLVRLNVKKDRCSHCGQCRKACPADLDPETESNSSRCARCFECLKCARGALELDARPRT